MSNNNIHREGSEASNALVTLKALAARAEAVGDYHAGSVLRCAAQLLAVAVPPDALRLDTEVSLLSESPVVEPYPGPLHLLRVERH